MEQDLDPPPAPPQLHRSNIKRIYLIIDNKLQLAVQTHTLHELYDFDIYYNSTDKQFYWVKFSHKNIGENVKIIANNTNRNNLPEPTMVPTLLVPIILPPGSLNPQQPTPFVYKYLKYKQKYLDLKAKYSQ
jgi:hypothetical protein